MTDDPKARIRLAIADGEVIGPPAADAPPPWQSSMRDTPTLPPAGGGQQEDGVLPPGCPVTVLGVHGDTYWFLDTLGQIRGIRARELSRLNAIALFSLPRAQKWMYEHYSKKRKVVDRDSGEESWQPIPGKLSYDILCEDLMGAAAQRGVWDPAARVRGAGAWEDDGRLLLHCGKGVLVVDADGRETLMAPGLLDDYVYPRVADAPMPAATRAAPAEDDGPARIVLDKLQTWNFRRGVTDARLCLGLMGAQMIGGALPWRPMGWLTGDTSTGKSTLQTLWHGILGGDAGSLFSSDASAAGLWQTIGYSSLPVRLDEIEASEDNRKAQAIVQLARQASSGGLVVRGGDRHEGHQFRARNCFLFSSMRIPPQLPQDRNRITVLELSPLPAGAIPPRLEARELHAVGAALRRRLVQGWPLLAPVLGSFKAALGELGHNARGQDQLGTQLACAWLLMHDDVPAARDLGEWCAELAPDKVGDSDAPRTAWQACIEHILSTPIDPYKGASKQPVSYYLERAAWGVKPDERNDVQPAFEPLHKEANAALGGFGLKLVFDREGKRWLAVRCTGQTVGQLFRNSQWEMRAGASTVWSADLQRAPGSRVQSIRIAGEGKRCVLVPYDLIDPDPPRWATAGADRRQREDLMESV